MPRVIQTEENFNTDSDSGHSSDNNHDTDNNVSGDVGFQGETNNTGLMGGHIKAKNVIGTSVRKTYNIAADVTESLKRSASALDDRVHLVTTQLQQTSNLLKNLSELLKRISSHKVASKAAEQFEVQLLNFQEMFRSIGDKIQSFDPKLHCQYKFKENLKMIVAEIKWRKDDLSLAIQIFELDLRYGHGGAPTSVEIDMKNKREAVERDKMSFQLMRYCRPIPTSPIPDQPQRITPRRRIFDDSGFREVPWTDRVFSQSRSTSPVRSYHRYPSATEQSDYSRSRSRRQNQSDQNDIWWHDLFNGERVHSHGKKTGLRSRTNDQDSAREYEASSEFSQESLGPSQSKHRVAFSRHRHREMPKGDSPAKTQQTRSTSEKAAMSITTEPPTERPDSPRLATSPNAANSVLESPASPNSSSEQVIDVNASYNTPTYACWSLRKKETGRKPSRSRNIKPSWKYYDKHLLHVSLEELHQELWGQRNMAHVIHKFNSIECRYQHRAIDTLIREQNVALQRQDESLSWAISELHLQEKKQGLFGFRKPDTVGMTLVLRTQRLPAFFRPSATIEDDNARKQARKSRSIQKASRNQDSMTDHNVSQIQEVNGDGVVPSRPQPLHEESRSIRAYIGGKPIISTGNSSHGKDIHFSNEEYQGGYSYIDKKPVRLDNETNASGPSSKSDKRKHIPRYDYSRWSARTSKVSPPPSRTSQNAASDPVTTAAGGGLHAQPVTKMSPKPRPSQTYSAPYVDDGESSNEEKTGRDAKPSPFGEPLSSVTTFNTQEAADNHPSPPLLSHGHPPPMPPQSQVLPTRPAYSNSSPSIPPAVLQQPSETVPNGQPSRGNAMRASRPAPPPQSFPQISIPPPSFSYPSIPPEQGWSSPRFASLDLEIPPSLLGIGPPLLPPPMAMQERSYEPYVHIEDATRVVRGPSQATGAPRHVTFSGTGQSRFPSPPRPSHQGSLGRYPHLPNIEDHRHENVSSIVNRMEQDRKTIISSQRTEHGNSHPQERTPSRPPGRPPSHHPSRSSTTLRPLSESTGDSERQKVHDTPNHSQSGPDASPCPPLKYLTQGNQ